MNSQGSILTKGNLAEIFGDQIDCNGFYCEDDINPIVEIKHTGDVDNGWICDYIK